MRMKRWTYKNNPRFNKENKKITELLKQKMTIKDIAKIFGCSYPVISKRIKYLGLSPLNRSELSLILWRKRKHREHSKCDFCHKDIDVTFYKFKNFKTHFCNKKCFNKYLKINPVRYWKDKKISKEHNAKLQKGREIYQKKGLNIKIRVSPEQSKSIMELYNKGYSSTYIGKLFNLNFKIILKELKKSGITIRDGYKGKKFDWISDDGHKVRSSPEMLIDNWLFNNGIIHSYDKNIGDTNYKYDFYIPMANLYIEYWGLRDLETYIKRMKEKLEVYNKLGLNLLSIFPRDNIPKKLNILLEFSQNQTKLTELKILK